MEYSIYILILYGYLAHAEIVNSATDKQTEHASTYCIGGGFSIDTTNISNSPPNDVPKMIVNGS